MWQAIVFGFWGGVMGANGYPHFTRGMTRKRYPGAFGNGPVPNVIAGWVLLVIAARPPDPQFRPGRHSRHRPMTGRSSPQEADELQALWTGKVFPYTEPQPA